MSQHRHGNAARDAHIWTLRGVIVVLVIGCTWFAYQSHTERQNFTVHIPPTLRSGSTRVWWKVPPASVYSFAFYVWQQINRWPHDGRADYKANIAAYRPYLTPGCRRFLKKDYQERKRRHELKNRVRGVYEIAGHGYRASDVTVRNRDHWIVTLDLDINQYLHGMKVRNADIRYFLRVVRHDVDPTKNPWGLQIDCFARPPQDLGAVEAAQAASGPDSGAAS